MTRPAGNEQVYTITRLPSGDHAIYLGNYFWWTDHMRQEDIDATKWVQWYDDMPGVKEVGGVELSPAEHEMLKKTVIRHELKSLWIGIFVAEDTQAAPVANDGPSMHDLVVAAVLERKEIGLKEYGTILQSHNGRDQLKDSIEEILDLACYLMAAKQERDALQAALVIGDAESEAMRSALKEKNREIELLEAKNRGLKKKLEESDEMITSEVASTRRALESALETARGNSSKLANRSYAQKSRGDVAVDHIRKLEITMEVLGLPFDKYVDTEVH